MFFLTCEITTIPLVLYHLKKNEIRVKIFVAEELENYFRWLQDFSGLSFG